MALEILADVDALFDLSDAAAEWAREEPTRREHPIPTLVLLAPIARCPQCDEKTLALDAGPLCCNEYCETIFVEV